MGELDAVLTSRATKLRASQNPYLQPRPRRRQLRYAYRRPRGPGFGQELVSDLHEYRQRLLQSDMERCVLHDVLKTHPRRLQNAPDGLPGQGNSSSRLSGTEFVLSMPSWPEQIR